MTTRWHSFVMFSTDPWTHAPFLGVFVGPVSTPDPKPVSKPGSVTKSLGTWPTRTRAIDEVIEYLKAERMVTEAVAAEKKT